MTELATIINFCSHDVRFLDKCIKSVEPFSSQILIPVCDHFFNGEPEDLQLLSKLYAKYPQVEFIEFAYSESEVYGTPSPLVPYAPGWSTHWHNSARLIGTQFLRPEIDQVLFLDTDEILEGAPYLGDYEAKRFGVYWYFRTAETCATHFPEGLLLIKRKHLNTPMLLNEHERMGMYLMAPEKKTIESKPIAHHYSWVRTEVEMHHKVRTWGHHWERDWEKLMKQEGDFVRGYSYKKVKPFWDPLTEEIVLPENGGKPAYRVTPKEVFRELLRAEYLSS